MTAAWQLVRPGHSVAFIQQELGPPPAGWEVLRVRCGAASGPYGVLLHVQQRGQARVLAHGNLFDFAADRLRGGLRRRLLGELPSVEAGWASVEPLQRLARHHDRPVVLLLEGAEHADPGSLQRLERIVAAGARKEFALVLSFDEVPADAAARAVLEAVRLVEGDSAVPGQPRPAGAPGDRAATAADDVDGGGDGEGDREGDISGAGGDIDDISGDDEDQGNDGDVGDEDGDGDSNEDGGEGDEDGHEDEREGDDGELGDDEDELDEAPRATAPRPPVSGLPPLALLALRAGAVAGPAFDSLLLSMLLERSELRVLEALQQAADAGFPLRDLGDGCFRIDEADGADLIEGLLPSLWSAWNRRLSELMAAQDLVEEEAFADGDEEDDEEGDGDDDEGDEAGSRARRRTPRPERAAGHLRSLGDIKAAAQQLLLAAEQTERLGEHELAVQRCHDALTLLSQLAESPETLLLQGRIRLTMGRIQWLGVSASEEFTLPAALAELRLALELLADGPPPLRVHARHAAAMVAYDIGDTASLEFGLQQLAEAVGELQQLDRPLEAARLLNDQAALLVRAGDPLRASALLRQSREIFEPLAGDGGLPKLELAQTDHLLARMPLHVAARPGLEAEAFDRALEHARLASTAYGELGLAREQARAEEVRARLLLAAGGHDDEAGLILQQVLIAQQRLGDVLGLARTTAAFSELLAVQGRVEEALALLHQSVQLNRSKGSAMGLAANREAIGRLAAALPTAQRAALGGSFEELTRLATDA